MNYRENIRKAIECPQFGNNGYGEWGALRHYQRVLIKRLLDDLDSDKCTHHEQFMMLKDFVKDDELGNKALNWIRFCYDCYYKEEILENEDTAFSYLKELIEKK